MKKVLIGLIAALSVFCMLAGCRPQGEDIKQSDNPGQTEAPQQTGRPQEAEEQVLRLIYQDEHSTMMMENAGTSYDYGGSASPSCTEGLLSKDNYGNLVYGLADSFSANEDMTVYTFHIREGLYWVNSKGEKTDELAAEDFVTVAKYVCNPENASNSAMMYQNVIKGATSALRGENENFEDFGFAALDQYTLQITLERPCPYFMELCTMYVPCPTEYYNSLNGEYGMEAETTWYIGSFYLTEWVPQYSQIYVKNPWYWDAENIYIDRIEMIYNAEANQLAPEMFQRGEIDVAALDSAIVEEWMNNGETANLVLPMEPTDAGKVYLYTFCYAPTFGEEYEQDNYLLAINNENFRKSISCALNRMNTKMVTVPYNTELYLSHVITPQGWCGVDGMDYLELDAFRDIVSDKNFGFDAQAAQDYRDAAIEELTALGGTFPVKLFMPYDPAEEDDLAELQVVAQQMENLLGEDYIDCLLVAGPASGFTSSTRRVGNYGFMRVSIGGNVLDPQQWTVAFVPGNNYNFIDQAQGDNLAPLAETYENMLVEAMKINTKSLERYNAYAEAEAFLVEHALVIPYSVSISGGYYKMTKLNPFERVIGVGATYKGAHLYSESITVEQYEQFQAAYLAAKSEHTSLG